MQAIADEFSRFARMPRHRPGLAIVHRIVSDHRGTMRVEDNAPQGTVFTVELPLR